MAGRPRQRSPVQDEADGRSAERELTQLVGAAADLDVEANGWVPGDKPSDDKPSDLTGEFWNIALLLVLYTLQGIPMGISAVFPMILKERGVSFSDVGKFSLTSWPFSLKLCWAPIVDTAYFERMGRRKTWMVPAQLLIGVVMICVSRFLEDLLYGETPAIGTLTAAFFLLYFLCATQDIAVDGWALTMLRRENVGYAATCNAAGQTLGYALGFTGYMVLEQFGIMSLSTFMLAWGVVFIIVTVAVALIKDETPVAPEDEPESIAVAYQQMLAMLRLAPMRQLIALLFTWKAAFPVLDSIAPLKFQEYGVPKQHLAYMTSLLMPMYIILPVFISRWASGREPLDLALRAYPVRVCLVPASALLAYLTPSALSPVPWAFYFAMLLLSATGAIVSQCMFVTQMAFYARISDPAMGGTYMTLLNTLSNLGSMWPPTVTFFLIDYTTCQAESCSFRRDGFYVVAVLCTGVGVVWYLFCAPAFRQLQRRKLDDWKVR